MTMSSTSTTTTASTSTTLKTGTQYGFFIDQSRCTGCHACALACKSWNMLAAGALKPLRVFQVEKGNWPNLELDFYPIMCFHCGNPLCIPAANGALIKEPKYGAVLIDPAQATSANLKAAQVACPYGAISFDSDAPNSTAFKCNMCVDRLDAGNKPACVLACSLRALDFDTMATILSKYGTTQQIGDLPSGTLSNPSAVFKPRNAKKTLIPYDNPTAIALWANRGSLPSPLPNGASSLQIPAGVVRHGVLNLHPGSVEEQTLLTTDVE